MFSVWPIVDVDDLLSRLNETFDLLDYALVLATAAATLGQLKNTVTRAGQCPSAELCEAEYQRARYVFNESLTPSHLEELSTVVHIASMFPTCTGGHRNSVVFARTDFPELYRICMIEM